MEELTVTATYEKDSKKYYVFRLADDKVVGNVYIKKEEMGETPVESITLTIQS